MKHYHYVDCSIDEIFGPGPAPTPAAVEIIEIPSSHLPTPTVSAVPPIKNSRGTFIGLTLGQWLIVASLAAAGYGCYIWWKRNNSRKQEEMR